MHQRSARVRGRPGGGLATKTNDPLAPIVLETPKRKIFEGGALQRRPLNLFAGHRAARSVSPLLSTTLSLV
ncbi:MAG: hypothetical protein VYA38_07675 [Gemmatimonadota bacterium]|nr:hypothetical protein [Gemmatimonadota bacterium]